MYNSNVIRSNELVEYEEALLRMDDIVREIYIKQTQGKLWLLEHPHLYTYGISGKDNELINPNIAPVYKSARGGKYTYHGPGQRIIYTMLNLKKLKGHEDKPDIKFFINQLEDWVISTLLMLEVKAYKVSDRIGIWIKNNGEQKIAAIGIRLSKWVSFHGIAVNISPDLRYYNSIIPCGLQDYGVCSLKSLGIDITLQEFDILLLKNFYNIFQVNLNEIHEI